MGLQKPNLHVREVSPKFIERWAKLYVERFLRDGSAKAIAWGTEFFHHDDIDRIAARAKQLLKMRGIKKPPEGA